MHLGRFKKGSTCGSTAVLCVCSDCVDMVLGSGTWVRLSSSFRPIRTCVVMMLEGSVCVWVSLCLLAGRTDPPSCSVCANKILTHRPLIEHYITDNITACQQRTGGGAAPLCVRRGRSSPRLWLNACCSRGTLPLKNPAPLLRAVR